MKAPIENTSFHLIIIITIFILCNVGFAIESLHEIVKNGDIAELKRYMTIGLDLNQEDRNGDTPLNKVIMTGRQDIAELLIAGGAAIELQNRNGDTPLHLASAKGNRNVVKILIDREVDINIRNKKGYAPLHAAAVRGHLKVAEMLIDNGADIQIKNYEGSTPLHLAAGWANADVVKFLISRGADVNAKNDRGQTPLDIAIRSIKKIKTLGKQVTFSASVKDYRGVVNLLERNRHEASEILHVNR